ncbi:unnamed protein product [Closterium sp. NIES-54]
MCDSCVTEPATLYCAADDAYICDVCDGFVHGANPLSQRHERVRLGPNGAPVKIFRRAGGNGNGNGNSELPAMVRGSGIVATIRNSPTTDATASSTVTNVAGLKSSRARLPIKEEMLVQGATVAPGEGRKRQQQSIGTARAKTGAIAKSEPQVHAWEPTFSSHCAPIAPPSQGGRTGNGQRSGPVPNAASSRGASASATPCGASDASRVSPRGVSAVPPPPHCYWRPDDCSAQGVRPMPPYGPGMIPPYIPPPHMAPYAHPWVAPPPIPGVVYPPGPWGPMYGPHMGMPYMGAAPSEYMGHPGDYAAVPHHPRLAESMRGPRPSKKQKRSGVHFPPTGATAVGESAERKVKQEAEGVVGRRPAEGTADEAFLDILSFDDVDRFFVDEADECTPVVDGRTGREVPDAPQIPHDHCAQQTQQPARGLTATEPISLGTSEPKTSGNATVTPSFSRASSSSGCGAGAVRASGAGESASGREAEREVEGEVKLETQGFEEFIISHGEEEGETEGWFVGGWGLDESAEAESEVDVEPLEGSPTAGDASGATSESAAALNPPQAHLGKRPRAEDVFGSSSGGPAAEGADAEGGMAVKLGSRKELQQQSPSLRLNYEDVISAWSDQAPEGQSPWIEQEEEEGASAEKRDGLNRPLLAHLPGLATASPSLPGSAQDTTMPSPGQQWGEHEQQQHEQEQPVMDSDTFEPFSNEGREARVLRYREKRRNRLFSKKIRYEVRKVNADQRPRVKGRFVKRTEACCAAVAWGRCCLAFRCWERQRSRKSAERQREMGKGKEKAERDQEKENQVDKTQVPISKDRRYFRRRRGFKWKRPIGEESTPRDAEDGVSSSAGSSSNISGRNNSSSGSSSGSSGGSSGGGERRTRSESRVSLKAGSISERSDADQSLSDRGMEEWEDLHGPVGFEFRVDASRSSGASSSSSSSGGGSGGNGLGGALLAGDGGLQGEEVLELMRMGEGGGMDDVWTDDEALSWPDAGRADWSDAEKWSDAEDWGAAEEWRVRDAWGDDEKWGDDKGLNGREEWGVTENWRAGADRERERAVEAKSQGQIRSHEPDLSGLAFAEQQQAGLPYAVGLASVQQPLDLLWADELSRGQWDGGGEMMGESTGLMGLESVGERQREEGGDGEGVGRKKREKGVKVKVVDLGRLKEKLEGFCKEQGLEPGTMPTRGIFRAARRSDIEKEIQFAGGVHAVAQKLNMQVARKPRGYWDDLANLKQEVLQFQMDHNLPHNKMPSRMLLQKHGRQMAVVGGRGTPPAPPPHLIRPPLPPGPALIPGGPQGQVLIRHPQPPPPTMLLPVGAGSIEAKFAAQHGEIQQLLTENQRLAATHVALRQELAAAQGEIQRTKATLAAVQMEKDQAVRGIMEHKAKLEADLRAVEPLRGELHRARMELQALQARGGEAEAGRAEMQRQMSAMGGDMQRMRSDLEGMRQELMQARDAAERERRAAMEAAEQREKAERTLEATAREVDRLRGVLGQQQQQQQQQHQQHATQQPPWAQQVALQQQQQGVSPQQQGVPQQQAGQQLGMQALGHAGQQNGIVGGPAKATAAQLGADAAAGAAAGAAAAPATAAAGGSADAAAAAAAAAAGAGADGVAATDAGAGGDDPVAECGWTEHAAPDGRPFYYHAASNTSVWEKPPELAQAEAKKADAEKAAAAATAGGAAAGAGGGGGGGGASAANGSVAGIADAAGEKQQDGADKQQHQQQQQQESSGGELGL